MWLREFTTLASWAVVIDVGERHPAGNVLSGWLSIGSHQPSGGGAGRVAMVSGVPQVTSPLSQSIYMSYVVLLARVNSIGSDVTRMVVPLPWAKPAGPYSSHPVVSPLPQSTLTLLCRIRVTLPVRGVKQCSNDMLVSVALSLVVTVSSLKARKRPEPL